MIAARIAGWLLAVAAIVFMSRTTPGYVDITAPFVVRGKPGEWVNGRTFGLRVEKPYLFRKLTFTRFGKSEARTTSGVWVIVRADAVAVGIPASVNYLALATKEDKLYLHTERVYLPSAVSLMGREFQPELPKPGLAVFEVPESALKNLELVAAEREFGILDSEVRIPLTFSGPIKDSVDLSP